MRRVGLALALALALLLPTAAGAKGKAKGKGDSGSGKRELHVHTLDKARHRLTVELRGFSKPPGANLFTFTDERDRHFVAMTITCDEVADVATTGGTRMCELELPAGYDTHPVKDLLLHVGSLKGRAIHAPPEELQAAFGDAEAAAPATE